jgi:putative pyrroloquinoline-quinone binding quinoprotein
MPGDDGRSNSRMSVPRRRWFVTFDAPTVTKCRGELGVLLNFVPMRKGLVTRLLIVLTVIVTSAGARTGVYDTAGVPVLHGRKWLTTTASNSFSAPVYAKGVLYVLDGSGHVIALDALTGRVKWTSPRIGSILSSPTVTEDAVYVGVETNGTVGLSIVDGSQIEVRDRQ